MSERTQSSRSSSTHLRDPAALERVAHALEHPLDPHEPPRCPRCGQRLSDSDEVTLPPVCLGCNASPDGALAGARLAPLASPAREFARGAGTLIRGLLRLLHSPTSWSRATAILIALNLALGLVAAFFSTHVAQWLGSDPFADSEGYLPGYLGWIASNLSVLPLALLVPLLTSYLLLAFPGVVLTRLAARPFADALSLSTQHTLLRSVEPPIDPPPPPEHSLSRPALLVSPLRHLTLSLLLLPLALIPLLGPLAWFLLPAALLTPLDALEPLIHTKRYGLRAQWRLIRTYSWRLLGFGLAVVVLMALPLVNALALAAAAAAAPVLFLEFPRK